MKLCLDLFCGTKSWSKAFREAGYVCLSLDCDDRLPSSAVTSSIVGASFFAFLPISLSRKTLGADSAETVLGADSAETD